MKNKFYIKRSCTRLGVVLLTIISIGLISVSFKTAKSRIQKQKLANKKKGLCIVTNDNGDWMRALKNLNVSWHYSWGSDLKNEPANIEFVPMIWGKWGCDDSTIDKLKKLKERGKIHYLLGFNEPDGKGQADMTVEEAIKLWPKLMEVGLPLGSPACVHPDNEWMQDFMAETDKRGYRVNFITVHWYGNPDVNGFVNKLRQVHKLYGLPIWITEFAVGDWSAKSINENKYSSKEVLAFMKKLLPELDKLSFVKRYAWYSANADDAHLGTSALFNKNGSLTPLGEYYANH